MKNFVVLKSCYVFLMLILVVIPVSNATLIGWPTILTGATSGFETNATKLLGIPNATDAASFSHTLSASYKGFNDAVNFYDTTKLALCLGISTYTLSTVDFMIFDDNGGNNIGFEGTLFRFEDGIHSLDFIHEFGAPAQGPVIKDGYTVDKTNFTNAFGWIPSSNCNAFLLFDLNPYNINTSSPNFKVTITGRNYDNGTPDIIMLGVVNIPEPSTFLLFIYIASFLALIRYGYQKKSEKV